MLNCSWSSEYFNPGIKRNSVSSSMTGKTEPPLVDGDAFTVVQVGEKPREWKQNLGKSDIQNMSKSQINKSQGGAGGKNKKGKNKDG